MSDETNYNEWLNWLSWEYNRYPDEELTRELFQETFGSVPGAHYYEKWVHYYEKNLLGMIAYFRGEEDKGQKFCDLHPPGKWSGMYRTGKHTRKTITYNNKHMAKFQLSNEVKPLDRMHQPVGRRMRLRSPAGVQ